MADLFHEINKEYIEKVKDFYLGNAKILSVEAPEGTGKNSVIKEGLKAFEQDFLLFQFYADELATTEDCLLNFYDTLRNYFIEKKIVLQKSPDKDFIQKVEGYFKNIKQRIVIIINNFYKLSSNKIMVSFLENLIKNDNIKLILISREESILPFYLVSRIVIKNDSKEITFKKLKSVEEDVTEENANKFWEITKGEQLPLSLTLNYIKTTGTKTSDILKMFEVKSTDFNSFIISKVSSLIPAIYMDLIYNLSLVNHLVSLNFLENYQIGENSQIEYLRQLFIINRVNNGYYLKDCLRPFFINSLSIGEKIEYTDKLISIYNLELSKSPKDRILRLSREGIRNRIEFLESLKPNIRSNISKPVDASLMAQSEIISSPWLSENDEKQGNVEGRENLGISFLNKETLLRKIRDMKYGKKTEEIVEDKTEILLKKAQEFENNFKYKEALETLRVALNSNKDTKRELIILDKIAQNYLHISKPQEAIMYYKRIGDSYRNLEDYNKYCSYELKIADIYKKLYDFERAAQIYQKLITSKLNLEKDIAANLYFGLASFFNSRNENNKALENYLRASALATGSKNASLVSEIDFAIASIYDERQEFSLAKEYYLKIAKRGHDKNSARACVNLGLILQEDNPASALEYFNSALAEYLQNEDENKEELYFIYKNLNSLYEILDREKCEECLERKYHYAQALEDNFKIVDSLVELGDYYYDQRDNEYALRFYLSAKNISDENISSRNERMIDLRIEDMKLRMDTDNYNKILEEYE